MADPHHSATEAADADAQAYVHGTQEINENLATWALVMNLFKWGSLALAVLILFLTLWFQEGGSFITGAIAGGVVAVAGWFFLKSGK